MTYYSLEEINKKQAKYNLILGKRDNGKSFSIKKEVVYNFLNYRKEFMYLRRFKEDIKIETVEGYFSDIIKDRKGNEWLKKWSKGKYTGVKCYRGAIYLTDAEGNKAEIFGRYAYLSGESHYKSVAFPNVNIIIFEEFITSLYYLVDEPRKLESFISTVLRDGEGATVYMVGNVISRRCPYFRYWSLENVVRQKVGTIDVYNFHTIEGESVKVAVELCSQEEGDKGKLFFGKSGKNIDGGEWEVDEYPSLEHKFEHYKKRYSMYYCIEDFSFRLWLLQEPETKLPLVYIYPQTRGDIEEIEGVERERIVSDRYLLYPLATPKLSMYKTKYDKVVERLIKEEKVRFSDNLTATEFNNIYRG